MTEQPEEAAGAAEEPRHEPVAGTQAGAGGLQKADSGKRILAAIIDGLLTFVVGFVPFVGGLVGAAYWLVRDGLELDFMDGRSIGKKVMKLRPVTLDGTPMDIMTSVKRNWMFALGGVAQILVYTIIGIFLAIPLALIAFLLFVLEFILMLTDAEGRRMGDKIANTMVIEVDD
jgi:uncharacterized RDD family membrane protein YckC